MTRQVPFAGGIPGEGAKRRAPAAASSRFDRIEIPIGSAPAPRELPVSGFLAATPGKQGVATQRDIPLSAAPALSRNFRGILFDDVVSLNEGFFSIPPDTMGAAGPSHLLGVVNGAFAVFNKATGSLDNAVSLDGFWAPLASQIGLEAAGDIFDPKVLFDQHSGRFVLVSIAGRTSPDSWILLAVSATSDPNGNWFRYALDADLDNGVQQFQNAADYPGLGVDSSNIYVTANMFGGLAGDFQYCKVWVVRKEEALQGANPIAVTEFRDPPGSFFTWQPAHVFGASGAEYFVSDAGFVLSGNPPRRFLSLASITFPGGAATWTHLGPIEVGGFPFAIPGAPQLGLDNLIDTGDTRMQNAVFRNGLLYTTHTVPSNDNTRAEAAWYAIDPGSASLNPPLGTPVQQGRISDPSRFYYYPSLAVNASGDIAFGFSGSSRTEFAGAYYTARRSGDPAGTTQAPGLLKAGVTSYAIFGGSGRNRWGDFSATCVDPADDNTFWTIQEYAEAQDPNTFPPYRWGTWWGTFTMGPPAPSPIGGSGFFGPAGADSSGGCAVARTGAGGKGGSALPWPATLLTVPGALLLRKRLRPGRSRARNSASASRRTTQ